MSINLRLQLLRLRQKVNLRIFRIITIVIYFIITAYVLVKLAGTPEVFDIASGDSAAELTGNGKFIVVGGQLVDFRKDDKDSVVPDTVKEFESLVEAGYGEFGAGVNLGMSEEIQKKWAFNKESSDKISLWRSLNDMRSPQCRAIVQDSLLPSGSVVIIFNNEALSALLRTVWSVLDRTPKDLLHEIILLDDGSNHTDITVLLPQYIKARLPPLVKLVRNPQQQGLIRARLAGAEQTTGDIIVFLDSHCEATQGWYQPLAQRIKQNPSVVEIPIIDGIDANDLSYQGGGGGSHVSVGGFTWSGHFTWESLRSSDGSSRKPTDPARTPTMAGGLFAVNREFFWHVGGYDPGMVGWGGENLEMSFRVWRCGGSMEIHPCSHVGHIFRPFHPYFIPEDSHGVNTARMAEVWMDDYKRFFYMHRDVLRGANIGSIEERKQIKESLQCKSFKWFLDNVYPEKFILDEDVYAWGRLKTEVEGNDVCVDHIQRDAAASLTPYFLGEYPCHPFLGDSQYFSLSLAGELRNEYMCATVQDNKVRMVGCSVARKGVTWKLEASGHVVHEDTGLCLDRGKASPGQELLMESCSESATQKWQFEFYAPQYQNLKPSQY